MGSRIALAAVCAVVAVLLLGSLFRGCIGLTYSLLPYQPYVQQQPPARGTVNLAPQAASPSGTAAAAPSGTAAASSTASRAAPALEAWVGIDEQIRRGTLGRPQYPYGSYAGGPFPSLARYASTLVLYLVSALVAGWLLWHAAPQLPNYLSRVGFVVVLGVFAGLFATVRDPLWLQHSWAYHIALVVNDCFTALVMGLVLAAMIRPAPTPPPIPQGK